MMVTNVALSLFAGVGFGVACHRLGIVEYGVENDRDVCATRAAAGMMTIAGDVRPVARDCSPVAYELLLAGPPCQPFSNAGRGNGRGELGLILDLIEQVGRGLTYSGIRRQTAHLADERVALVLMPLLIALRDLPEAIVLEQVPTVLPVWEAYATELRRAGYSAWAGVVSAEQYGVPQTRRRAMMLASRVRAVDGPPAPTHSKYHVRKPTRLDDGVPPWVSMADALGGPPGVVGFPRVADNRGPAVQIGDKDYRARDLRSTEYPSWAVTGKTRSWRRWGFTERPAHTVHGHGLISRGPTGAKTSVAAALEAGTYIPRPPYTLETARKRGVQREDYLSITDRYHTEAVNFTPEEGAILQTFAPDFPFRGTRTKIWQTIGNAVPPRLAEHLVKAVRS